MIDIAKVLNALGIHDIIVHGSPSSETEFFTQCKKIVGTTETNEAILSTDPKDFEITWAEVEAKHTSMVSDWEANAYSRNRQAEYPDMGSQLNKIYDDGLTKWKSEMVDPVKAKWPKDNSGPK